MKEARFASVPVQAATPDVGLGAEVGEGVRARVRELSLVGVVKATTRAVDCGVGDCPAVVEQPNTASATTTTAILRITPSLWSLHQSQDTSDRTALGILASPWRKAEEAAAVFAGARFEARERGLMQYRNSSQAKRPREPARPP